MKAEQKSEDVEAAGKKTMGSVGAWWQKQLMRLHIC